jgi:hypothetical protein
MLTTPTEPRIAPNSPLNLGIGGEQVRDWRTAS